MRIRNPIGPELCACDKWHKRRDYNPAEARHMHSSRTDHGQLGSDPQNGITSSKTSFHRACAFSWSNACSLVVPQTPTKGSASPLGCGTGTLLSVRCRLIERLFEKATNTAEIGQLLRRLFVCSTQNVCCCSSLPSGRYQPTSNICR